MSKMRRNRMVAILTLGATMLSGAAVTYARTTDVYSRRYNVVGSVNLTVVTRYTAKWGKDLVSYSLNLYGDRDEMVATEASTTNQIYLTRFDGKLQYLTNPKDYVIDYKNRSLSESLSVKDAADITIRSDVDDSPFKFCYAENLEAK